MTTPETPPTDEFPVQHAPTGTTGTPPAGPADDIAAIGTTSSQAVAKVTKGTRTSGTWIAVIVAAIVLVFLLIFILANLTPVTVTFLGMSGELPLGVALLFAAISGALLVALVGAARILQLRRRVRRVAKGS
ncbi:LapA family protein [Kibdelosporangium phytohabitans]|uniref:LapA family protein n=1 Tax=Kibdelosporangium phytohabitans TaxID=860235 RepID=UPI0009FA2F21|nr:lipopolysaccharide assembly protein LapA domain-containing protein [Kibdelosporangium phytohabitans]MBE1462680.1 putative integral membrane protein [Kibdelosporangium phytohabitans]